MEMYMLIGRLLSCCFLAALSFLSVHGQVSFMAASSDDLRTAAVVPSTARVIKPPTGLMSIMKSNKTVRVSVPTADGLMTIVGEPFDLFTPEAMLVSRGADGETTVDIPEHAVLRGRIEGRPGSTVFLAAFSTHIVAMIEISEPDGKRRYMISPDTIMPGRMAMHVFYEVRAGQGTPTECHAETLPDYQRKVDSVFRFVSTDAMIGKYSGEQSNNATPYALQLAFDCTESFYKNLGSNLTAAASSVITIAGACAVVYSRDANVVLRVPYLRIWTSKDPYPGDQGAKLGAIRDHWEANMKHVNRSVTCMISGEGGGGLAWVGVLCGGYGYNVSGVDGKVNFPATGYVWDVDVTSHELGHNIGSSHTQSCSWNPPIDSCWNAEGGCYQGTRVQRGTIMSYCHLQWKGTELQFHPRVAALFNRIMASTWCVAPLPSQRDTDIAVIGIRVPVNGAYIGVRQSFVPSITVKNLGAIALTNVPVTLTITDIANNVKKTLTATIQTLTAGATTGVTFLPVSIDTAGDYLAVAKVNAPKDQHATNDIVTRPFRVGAQESGTVTVGSPNGGETLVAGSLVDVRFTAQGVATVMLDYSVDDGATWQTLRASASGASGTIQWTVPFMPSTQCLVRVSSVTNAQITDVSNARFTIDVPTDVQAYNIVMPGVNTTAPTPLTSRVVVRNVGRLAALNVKVRLTMRWVRSTAFSFDTTITLASMPGLAVDTISFGSTQLLANGVHVMQLTVQAAGDSNSANDKFDREFTATGLTPPSDVRFEEGQGRVLLQWLVRNKTLEQRVEVWRGQSVEEMAKIRTLRTSVNAFVDTDLLNDTTYLYALRVVQGNAKSVFTPFVVTRPRNYPAGNKLGAPALVSPNDGLTSVPVPTDLVWTTVDGGDQYEVQVALDATFQDLESVFIVRDPGAITVPLDFNATRRWRVRALNVSSTSPWSASATFTTARNCAGSALTFNGTSTKGTDASLSWSGGPVTVEYWTYVKRSELANSASFMVGTTANAGNRFQAHAPWSDGVLYWDYGNLNDKGRITAPMDSYFDQWVHIALVSDGLSFKAIYFNGQLASSSTEASQPTSTLTEFTLGAMRDGLWFTGSIDEFRIWSEVRTEGEIRASMFRRMPPSSDNAKLVGAWRFEEGVGTLTKDAVRNRTLMLSSATMWTPSGASISCGDIGSLNPPSFTSGVGTKPLPRTHTYDVAWSAVATQRGNVWYDCEVLDPTSNATIIRANNVVASSSTAVRYSLRGLSADSTMKIRIRARSAYTESAWKESAITTLSACESSAPVFSGKGERFTGTDFLFAGKAVTVEYWSLVNPDQIRQSVAFMVGESNDESKRLQAHAPWDDKTCYWDYGNWREAGRVSASYDKQISRWTHVALVSNGYDTMAIYFDGVLAKQTSFADAPGILKQLTIGGNPYTSNYHSGSMRDLRLWNVMRSEKQIREGMNERIAEPRSGLLGSWLLDEGKGLRTTDVTGRSADARSSTELNWQDATMHLMHAQALIRGRRTVQRGDTAMYQMRTTSNITTKWTVVGGTIESSDVTNECMIKWTGADSVGVVTIARTWAGGCSDASTFTVKLFTTLSADQDTEEQSVEALRIIPNPTSDVVRIVCSMAMSRVELIDLQGRIVARVEDGSNVVTLPTREIASGMYTVRAVTTSGTLYSKVLVQR